LASDWQPYTWEEIVSLEYGKALRGYADAKGDVRVFGSNGPVGWTDKALWDGPGVILGRKGAYRGVEYSAGPFYVIDTAYYLVPKIELDMRWLYYAVIYHRLGEIDDGSPIPSTTRAAVYARELDVPDIQEQGEIAAILAALDDKIELNRQTNETLEAMAQAIFRDWFVDFGPTRRKAAGEGNPVAVMGGLAPDPARAAELAALFPAAFGEEDLPMGWAFAPLSDLLVLQRGFDLPKTKRTDGDFPVIAASGPSGTHNEFKVKGPGVCTGRSGVLGGVYYVETDFWPLNTSLWIKDYPGSSPLHACHLLRGIDLASFNAGSAVPTLNRNHVHGLPTVKPPMVVVRAFDALVRPFYAKMAAGDGENVVLSETRDYLLPRLMSGAVRVAPKVEAA
jgi:type I restriction enzyme S subunit